MNRKAQEIQEIKNQMSKMMGMIEALQSGPARPAEPQNAKPATASPPSQPQKYEFVRQNFDKDPRLVDLLVECMSEAEGVSGKIKFVGSFSSADHEAMRILETDTDRLLGLITDGMATRVLSCIGSAERLNLLRALLRQPMSVSQMIETVGYNTTGQAYHHLKALQAAALVEEDKDRRGTYRVAPHRISGLILLLAGIHDLSDGEYTKGEWTE